MPDVVNWQQGAQPETVAKALQHLTQQGVVLFPTDTTYVAACLASVEAPAKLAAACQTTTPEIQLGVQHADAAREWVPWLSIVGQRFLLRCWPGPVTIVCPEKAIAPGTPTAKHLPPDVNKAIWPDQKIRLRCPAHVSLLTAIAHSQEPVVFAPVFNADGSPMFEGNQLGQIPPDNYALAIDDGRTQYLRLPAILEVNDDSWAIVRESGITEDDFRRLSSCYIVFVCTGNTCRSPMAEALCKKLLAQQLGCSVEQLPQHGYVVESAGVSAMAGMGASPEAIAVVGDLGADLNQHQSQPVSEHMLAVADHILTMTRSHLDRLLAAGIPTRATPQLLSQENQDIDDPIGAPPEVYQACAQQIMRNIQQRLPEFVRS
ncbi:MAG: Sua5/YciO/YrdC/YwlC family protein [Gemmataceae bacterium]